MHCRYQWSLEDLEGQTDPPSPSPLSAQWEGNAVALLGYVKKYR